MRAWSLASAVLTAAGVACAPGGAPTVVGRWGRASESPDPPGDSSILTFTRDGRVWGAVDTSLVGRYVVRGDTAVVTAAGQMLTHAVVRGDSLRVVELPGHVWRRLSR